MAGLCGTSCGSAPWAHAVALPPSLACHPHPLDPPPCLTASLSVTLCSTSNVPTCCSRVPMCSPALPPPSCLAGAFMPGEFEERMKGVLRELTDASAGKCEETFLVTGSTAGWDEVGQRVMGARKDAQQASAAYLICTAVEGATATPWRVVGTVVIRAPRSPCPSSMPSPSLNGQSTQMRPSSAIRGAFCFSACCSCGASRRPRCACSLPGP